jgi:hypothetical protein
MRLVLTQLALAGLLMSCTSGYSESLSGMWRSKEVVGKSLEMREDGSFSLEESGEPDDGSVFNIEFSLAPGNSYLGYGVGPLPDSIRSEAVVTAYKISVPLRDWQFVIRGHWMQKDATLQLNIAEFEIARVNGATVTEYVAQQVSTMLTDVSLSAAESEELSRLLSQTTPMRGGMEDSGGEVILQFSVLGDDLQTVGTGDQFSGDWVRELPITAVPPVSWGELKGMLR